ncbi:MAG: T9SS type A sorting domain-containing protein, partial [Saprospiraceae bacterium]
FFDDGIFDGDGISIIDASGHYDGAASILLQPDNKIVLGGYAHSDIEGGNMALVRLNSNGIRDFSFDGDGISEFAACNSSDFIYGMAMQADGKIIAAGLLRNGFYNNIAVARFLTGLTVSTKEETIPLKSISLYPNPICEKIFMEYDLEKEESITIKLLDIQGRLVETLLPLSDRSPGQHTETLSVHQLPSPGNYFVSLETRHNSEVLMVVVK